MEDWIHGLGLGVSYHPLLIYENIPSLHTNEGIQVNYSSCLLFFLSDLVIILDSFN